MVIVMGKPRVGRVLHPAVELYAQLGLGLRVTFLAGNVPQLVRVLLEIIQLLGWAFSEAESEGIPYFRLETVVKNELFSRPGIAISERFRRVMLSLGVSCG